MSKPIQEIVKTYPMRGPMSQFTFDSSLSFICFRCKSKKTSKLISIYRDDWNLKLCNGCYGCLISLYEIKSGMDPDEKRFLTLDKSIIAFFSELIAKSQSFRNTSSTFVLIKFFSEKRPLSSWLYSENGAHLPLQELVGNFRNNAAHIKELTKKDYLDCEELTLGSDGVLVKVLLLGSLYNIYAIFAAISRI